MSDKNFHDFTIDEKLDVLLESMANITLFILSKYPDYAQEVESIRKNRHKEIIEALSEKATNDILKKLTGE